MRTFCARCGRSESPGRPLIQGLCPDCFTTTRRLVQLPERIEVVRCRVCGSLRSRRGRFSKTSLSSYIRDLVEEHMSRGRVAEGINRLAVNKVEIREGVALVTFSGSIGEVTLNQTIRVEVLTKSSMCPECFKQKTRRYEAVIQLRPGNRRATTLVSKIADELSAYPNVVEVEESRSGVDIHIAERSTAVRIVRELESNYVAKVTPTWEGSKYGHRKPRAVFSIRVYSISRGDPVIIQGSRYEIAEATPRSVVLIESGTSRVLNIALNDFWRQNPVFPEES
ncbi:MAG: NMD3-related protein [Sulfolobales archaeon]|nr:60S ribosomal export protein NMD3 [Sulfolobales archaeon]MDW8082244.1 NMD3-related protein [Sulfolobales archaeon]